MTRAYNFSPGPATLPDSVLEEVQRDLLDFRGTGCSVLEISHRSPEFMDVAKSAEDTLRRLLDIGDDYAVLFLQGGPTLQFTMVPLNLSGPGEVVEYTDTGRWSQKAFEEAHRLRNAYVVAQSDRTVPAQDTWERRADSRYVHITSNETIAGVQFKDIPKDLGAPLVADMSSDFLTRKIDVEDFGIIYAGAQKNFGPAGLTTVIVRKELCQNVVEGESEYLNYSTHIEYESMYNTPNTFAWYVADLVLHWIERSGGVAEMQRRSSERSQRLYDVIDSSELYQSAVERRHRSAVNVSFFIEDDELEARFLNQAAAANIVNIRGHRLLGGFRASLYNGLSDEAVDALVDYMIRFERGLGK